MENNNNGLDHSNEFVEIVNIDEYPKTCVKEKFVKRKRKFINFAKEDSNEEFDHEKDPNVKMGIKCPKPKCNFEAKNQTGMSCHLSQHKDCPYCELSFSEPNGKRNLQRHLKKHEKHEKNQIHKCQICCKVFKFPSRLKIHIKIHEKVKTVYKFETKCQICNKDFKFSSNLECHLDSSKSCAIEKFKKTPKVRHKIIKMEKTDHDYAKKYSTKQDSITICDVFENVVEFVKVETETPENHVSHPNEKVNFLGNNEQIQIDPFCDLNIKLEPFDENLVTEEILSITPHKSVDEVISDNNNGNEFPFTGVKYEQSVEETEFINFVSFNSFDENTHQIKSEIKDEPP